MLSFPISFEFFPPKTHEGMNYLTETANQLAKCVPAFFSVTFGAGGSTRQGTIDAVTFLQKETAVPVAAHIACLGSSNSELLAILNIYKKMGVNRLVALRGDLPKGLSQKGELCFASDLVTFIKETMGSFFHIEVAAYPEIHPEAQTPYDDMVNLKRKYEAGADSAITQYFFSSDAYFYFLEDCHKQGIHMPIVPGIMPITQFDKLIRFSALCGAEIPRWIAKRLEYYANDTESIKSFGIEVIYQLCEKLLAGGAPGLHFYTLNQAEASLTLAQLLSEKHQYQPAFQVIKKESALSAL